MSQDRKKKEKGRKEGREERRKKERNSEENWQAPPSLSDQSEHYQK